jgi:hypothetical protein
VAIAICFLVVVAVLVFGVPAGLAVLCAAMFLN